MNEAEYQFNFPDGVSIPPLLRELLHFQNQSREWYSGHFELDKWPYGQSHWFQGERAVSERFIVIGHGPDGSLYALWLHSGQAVEVAPIVFLGSEGTGCSLIADNLTQFLSLLAIGADDLGFNVSWGEIVQGDPPAKRLTEFREWLKARLGISSPSEPLAVIKEARSRHPDFVAWLEAWRASGA